jgi:Flp pilus assembly pilin Flp
MAVEAAMLRLLGQLWREENGQDLIEYSLLITFIAIACMWFVGAGGPTHRGVWTSANNTVDQANTTAAS